MVRDHNKNNNFEDSEIFTYTKDHLGSIRELTNKDQKLVQRYDYSAYGFTTLEKTENRNTNIEYVENIYAYTARPWLQLTGDYEHFLRWRNQDRFLSTDPFGVSGDGPNLYIYALGNPTGMIDPFGTLSFCENLQRRRSQNSLINNPIGMLRDHNGNGTLETNEIFI